MLKKFFSNMNTAQRVFIFIPIVFIVTMLVGYLNFFPLPFYSSVRPLGTFFYLLRMSLGVEPEVESWMFIHASNLSFSIIICCIIGFFLFWPKNKNREKNST